jgi:magnesium transporter
MIEIYFKTIRDADFKKINDFRAGSWIYVSEARLDDLTKISEITGLDLIEIRDSLDKYELPRIERAGENILLFVRHPGEMEPGLYTQTLTLILTNSYVIAITPHKSEIIEQLLSTSTSLGTTQKGKLLLQILLKITQDFTNGIKRVRNAILNHEQAMKIVDSNAIIVLTKNEEILNQYLTALVPMRNLLETVSSNRHVPLHEKDVSLVDDLMIAIRQSEDVCRVNIKSIRSLRDSYQIIFTNDVNRTIKLLTALTIIFTIPTITASLYGMNVALPLQQYKYAFWLILGLTGLAATFAIWLFQRKRWL